MARVRVFGQTFSATPVRRLPDGSWIMTANEHAARCVPGAEIKVAAAEIIEMAAAETPDPAASQAALDAAMAEERKTLTPVAELLAAAPKTVPGAGE